MRPYKAHSKTDNKENVLPVQESVVSNNKPKSFKTRPPRLQLSSDSCINSTLPILDSAGQELALSPSVFRFPPPLLKSPTTPSISFGGSPSEELTCVVEQDGL